MEKEAESTSNRRAVDAEDGPKEDLRPGEEEKGATHGDGKEVKRMAVGKRTPTPASDKSSDDDPRVASRPHKGSIAPEETDKDPCRSDGAGNSGEHGPREWEPAHPGGNTCGTAHTLVSPGGRRPDYNDRQWRNKTTSIQNQERGSQTRWPRGRGKTHS